MSIKLTPSLTGHLALLLTTLVFGLNGPLSKILFSTEGFTPYIHMFCRFFGAGTLFWIISLFAPQEKIARKDWLPLLGASLTGVLFNQGVFAIGISMTSPLNQSLLATLGPIITMLFAALWLREPITRKKALGVLLGASGAILLILGRRAVGTSSLWGDLVCLSATVSYCLYLTLFKRVILRYSPITLMKWLFLFSGIIAVPRAWQDLAQFSWTTQNVSFYFCLLFVVLMATFLAYFLLPIAQKRLRPTVVSTYNYGLPVVATIVALLLGQDTLTLYKALAFGLVIGGVYLVTQSKSRQDLNREKREHVDLHETTTTEA